jgi:hypothetical protein
MHRAAPFNMRGGAGGATPQGRPPAGLATSAADERPHLAGVALDVGLVSAARTWRPWNDWWLHGNVPAAPESPNGSSSAPSPNFDRRPVAASARGPHGDRHGVAVSMLLSPARMITFLIAYAAGV